MKRKAYTPPLLATWLLRRVIAPDIQYAALGDFEEIYASLVDTEGPAAAKRWYWAQVARSVPAFILDAIRWTFVMLKNYLFIALRNLRRQKGYTVINISGLAMGLACCLLIALYVHDELSFDQYHEKAERIFRVTFTMGEPPTYKKLGMVGPTAAPDLKARYPEVEDAVRFIYNPMLLQRQDDPSIQYQENGVLFADASVTNVFSYPWLKGDPQTALASPYSLVLTEEAAQRYFGSEDPIGKALIRDGEAYTVTGVLGAVPENSHFTFDILTSMATLESTNPDFIEDFWALFIHTYVLLSDEQAAAGLVAKLPEYLTDQGVEAEPGSTFALGLEPLRDIYLRSDYHSSLSQSGSLNAIYIFSGTALFILLIACINFINLATARSTDRAKEVGVRKVMGAHRRQVALQFLGETLLLATLSTLLAVVVAFLALPAFNTLSGKFLSLALLGTPTAMFTLVGITLSVGLIAGGYPAFVLSGFRPISVLRGVFRTSIHGTRLRRSLVVFQFALSIGLMVSTGVVFSQLDYMQTKNLGFDKEHMLVIDFHAHPDVRSQLDAIKHEISQHPDVIAVSASGDIPGQGNLHASAHIELPNGEVESAAWRFVSADFDFIDKYGIEMVAGRAFSSDFPTDSMQAMVINEALVERLGFVTAEEALGAPFRFASHEGTIIGVAQDFHLKSLQEQVEPVYMLILPRRYRYVSLRLDTDDITRTMAELEDLWAGLVPQRPFEYLFLDQTYDNLYRAEMQIGQVVGVFTSLAMLVACLGLFGLASLTIQQRTKEIGMRRVLGASVSGLALLLTKDFAKLVGIAFVVAAPVAFFAMDGWLNNFAYRTSLGVGPFILAGLLALIVAGVTVSYKAVRAASANPVNALRHE